MDLDQARCSLTMRLNEAPKSGSLAFSTSPKEEYKRIVEENLALDPEGKPFKMLVFKDSPRRSGGRLLLVDEMLHDDQDRCKNRLRPIRSVPKSADKILDAPNLVDDYYLNLMDWGSKNILALALGDSLYLWNATSGDVEELLTSDSDESQPASVAWSSDGRTLAVGFTDSTVQIWDTAAARQVRVLRGHRDRVSSLSWNCNLLSSGSRDASIINHDVRAGASSASRFQGHSSEVCGLRWSAGGNLLASGGNDNRVFVWEAPNRRSSRHLHRLHGHSAAVRALAWSPHQPNLLASGGGTADRSIKFWNTQAGSCATTVDTGSQVCALEWNRHRSEILSAHGFSRNQLSLWSYPSMLKVGDMNGHSNRVLHLSQSPDGMTVASAGADETLRFWKVFGPPQAIAAAAGNRKSSGPSFSMNRSFIR
ncbi:unnamed protein product [Spirodela intermedia]|uniref:CDC20/Fizzy WD40 domain-containing protein n=1 Tax=Spirodela intermedia TaxID=51605 RepID=A0A7I8LBR8_SPIIN|nr:unnamed protein product [Spirodela intermedia]